MFGLRKPITKTKHEDEFDSVSTILSHSSVARSLKSKQASPWITAIENDGCIFYLELPADVEAKLVRVHSGDGGSVSSLATGIGCNSEDTGYSSDQDLSSADHNFNIQSKPGNRKKNTSPSIGKLYSNCSKVSRRKSTISGKVLTQISSSSIHELEKESDDLSVAKSDKHAQVWLDLPQVTTHVSTDQTLRQKRLLCLEDEDGVCLSKSDFRSSKASSISSKSDSSLNSVESSKLKADKSVSTSNNIRSGHKSGQVNTLTTSVINKVKPEYTFISVNIFINSSWDGNSENGPHRIPGVTVCEHLLGIVPVHRDDFDSMGKGQSSEVIVKGIIPGSPASFQPEIAIGSVLHTVNGQEVTWDNMNSLLSSLRKLKKMKLTMKSMRPGSSPVDLETLVNILTSDTVDLHTFDKVAAMYISLEGVDPNSPDANDGMIYSFPSEHNSLHQLLGLFYTLSHLVRDINRSNTIKNTTLSLDEQKIHIAYLQEGNDILVFAVPAVNASVSQLNSILMEFSRLLQVLFGSVECAFTKGLHSVFIDNILTYLFRKILSVPVTSSLLSSSLSSTPDLKKGSLPSESYAFVRYSQHVQAMALPDEVMTIVGMTLSEYESSNFADMSEDFYGCRRQYTILGSTFFYCGQLVCSHLASEDLHDLQLYLGHLGIFDLMARSSVAQFVAWREIFPTRFYHDVAEINNNFGYSEPTARWCWLIVGLKHGLFCTLLETVGLTPLQQSPLSPDVFYIDQAKACVLQLQTPQLLAVFNVRVSRDSQSPVAKSDYCATYVNTTGENKTRIFSDEYKRTNPSSSLMLSLQSNWIRNSISPDNSVDNLYKSPRGGKIYPGEYDGTGNTSLTTASQVVFPNMPALHKLSTSRHPSLYQYCCLDGLEGTVIVGSDVDNSGIFHTQIVHSFYQCCRQIHSYFITNRDKHKSLFHKDEDDDDHSDPITSDPHLKGMKEHGILMTFNPHQSEEGYRNKWALEYWVVGRRIKRPSVKEMYVCFNASTPQNVIELAFRLSFGSFS